MPDSGPLELPAEAWRAAETGEALHARDVGQLLVIAQRYTGASQARLATAIGLGQSRTNEIVRGRRSVASLDVLNRIALGLSMPDDARMLFGLAPSAALSARSLDDLSGVITRTFDSPAAAVREIRRAVSRASSIDVLAVRGVGLLGLNDSAMRAEVARRRDRELRIRVALLDPAGRFAAARASEIGESIEVFASGVRLAETHLADLARLGGLDVSVFHYDALPAWRVIAVDDVLFVGTFAVEQRRSSAIYRLDPGSGGALHAGMRRMCDGVFAQAQRIVTGQGLADYPG